MTVDDPICSWGGVIAFIGDVLCCVCSSHLGRKRTTWKTSHGNGCMVTSMLSSSLPVISRRMAEFIWFMYSGTLCSAL